MTDEAVRGIAQIARDYMEEDEPGLGMIQQMIQVCEKNDVPRDERVDVITDGVERHLEQSKQQALQEFEDNLRRVSGL